jgi:hypothetical protein
MGFILTVVSDVKKLAALHTQLITRTKTSEALVMTRRFATVE